jgi:cellulose synthase/poly-beta-1,6-N-acetylglucosamine synthase-like glycosyltransferase/peptidoglycan/xylan/chitin deacetylase (PgdA/CDA1 family)
MVTLVFVVVLLVQGYVNAVGKAGTGHPAGAFDQVPEAIRSGGSIVDATHQPARSFAVPAKTVVLTFDDGPDPTWTPEVLATLRKYQVHATFFAVGARVLKSPDLVQQAHADGNEIGIHTFSHPDLAQLSSEQRLDQLSRTQLAIAGATGTTSALLRPPYSSSASALDNDDWAVVEDVGRHGYLTVLTDRDSLDWERPGVSKIVQNATPDGNEGAIILMHDAGGDRSETVEALNKLIPALQKRGYTFRTVTQALAAASGVSVAAEEKRTDAAASSVDHWRGWGLSLAARIADGVVSGLLVLLGIVGLLVVVRLILMMIIAWRHARKRHRPGWCWGPPVSEPVSVIVPAYNEKEGIAQTVMSLVASDYPDIEVIVVDDGSTDETAAIAHELSLPSVLVVSVPNSGKANALNHGLTLVRNDLVVMLDGDTVFEPQTLRRLVQPFADPRVGAVAGNVKVANRRRMVARWQHIEYVIGFNIDRRMYDVLQCMPTVPGACGAYRRSALVAVGGMSDDTLAEDTDLTMALCRAGWHVVYEETAHGWTEAPTSIGQLWRQRYRWSYGTMQAMWKHRRAVIESGNSGRFGRVGLLGLALFQIVLPVFAPLIDILALDGLVFFDPLTTAIGWFAMLTLQFLGAILAFRLDGEKLRPLWALPLQQFVYRQLMYAIIIQSIVTALAGTRLRWHKLRRFGAAVALNSSSR